MKSFRLKHHSIDSTSYFSNLIKDYLNEEAHLSPYITDFPSLDAIGNQLEKKHFSEVARMNLYNRLVAQYEGIAISDSVKLNMEKLQWHNTYTVCTAHQPSVFTGYLYFIYKIAHTIRLAYSCKQQYPDFEFVPIFYIGSEDNDVDEIGSFHYDGQLFRWATTQTGPCGRMSTTDMNGLFDEYASYFNTSVKSEQDLLSLFSKAYRSNKSLADACRVVVNELFGNWGIVIVDADDSVLKSSFSTVILDELLHERVSQVSAETLAFLSSEYHIQASPREINLFYIQEGMRERIERSGDKWHVVNTSISFTKQELEEEVRMHPDRFSPNVMLRPLYQESILPNLAFVGGGGELAYWMQQKCIFDYYQVAFPLLLLRNSIQWIPARISNKMNKYEWGIDDIFEHIDLALRKRMNTQDAAKQFANLYDEYADLASRLVALLGTISEPMKQSGEAHIKKMESIWQRLDTKLIASLKRKDADLVQVLTSIKSALFPSNSLQERKENLLFLYKQVGASPIDFLVNHIECFGKDILVFIEEESENDEKEA